MKMQILDFDRAEIQETVDELPALQLALQTYPLDTAEQRDTMAILASEIASRRKAAEEQLAEVTRPLRETERTVRSWFAPLLDGLTTCRAIIDRRLAAALIAQQQAETRALRAAEEALVDGNPEPALALVAPAPKPEGISTRSSWRAIVEDAALVPREWLVVDEKRLSALARGIGKGQPPEIPGVRFQQETGLVVRRK